MKIRFNRWDENEEPTENITLDVPRFELNYVGVRGVLLPHLISIGLITAEECLQDVGEFGENDNGLIFSTGCTYYTVEAL